MPTPTHEASLPDLPARPGDGHKGTFGTVIVIGGCQTMIGAPALTAWAALRAGVGLVKSLVDPVLSLMVPAMLESVTDVAWDGSIHHLLVALDEADPKATAVLAVGPGWGRNLRRKVMLQQLLMQPRSMVIDADGLFALALLLKDHTSVALNHRVILTPHPGEFARLAEPLNITPHPKSEAERTHAAKQLADRLQATVILKGAGSVITDGKHVSINQTGNACLATAGTGDVLTGVAASLLAQGMTPFDAAVLAAHLHGLAGDLWRDQQGKAGLLATELADLLPKVM